jgi:hypothetical protein
MKLQYLAIDIPTVEKDEQIYLKSVFISEKKHRWRIDEF